MGQMEDLRLFVTIVDQGSIARAASVLGIAKSAVSRRLAQLEDRYGVRLIDRQPRAWEVTTAGHELYQRATDMVADADDLDTDFGQAEQSLSGPLKVTIAREFGLSFLTPTLFAFMEAHPEIGLTIDFDDRTVDLENENYDMAVRIAGAETPGLTCLPLGATRHGLFASPGYIERHGAPESLSDLSKHALLHYGSARRARWDFICYGKTQIVTFRPALNSNNGPFLVEAALNGLGITRMPDFIVRDTVQAGKLLPVLPEVEIAAFTIQVAYRTNRRLNKRMRAFISALEKSCALLGQKASSG